MESDKEISILKSYRKLAEGLNNQKTLIKEKTGVLYAAAALENENIEIVKVAIDIFQLLILNEQNHNSLMAIFGVFEALETVAIRLRSIDEDLAETVRQMIMNFGQASPPAYNTRHRARNIGMRPNNVIFVFQIAGLNPDTRENLETTVVSLRGVVSVVIDVDHQRCTLRVLPRVSARYIAQTILEKTGLKARYIIRNTENKEVLRDLLDNEDQTDDSDMPSYLSDEEVPNRSTAVSSLNSLKQNASDWVKTATNFWNKTFYW